jgi:hypothetical protein
MDDRIGASLSEPVHPLIERALTSKIPIAELIGFGIEEIGGGRAVASLRSGPQHANPMGTLHGGVRRGGSSTEDETWAMSNVMSRIRRANTSRRHVRPYSSCVASTQRSVDVLSEGRSR